MKNKFMAFLLIAIMLMATCSVSATKYIATTMPETGVIVFDDFDGDPVLNNDNAAYRSEIRGDGLYGEGKRVWAAFYDPIATKTSGTDHGTTAFVSADKVGANGSAGAMYYQSAWAPFGKTTINTGRTLLSYDIYVPGGRTIGSKDLFWMNTSFWGDNGHKAYPITVMVTDYTDEYSGEAFTQAQILFQTAAAIQYHDVAMVDNKEVRDLETDKWYDVDILIDYDGGSMSYYLDGNYVATYGGSADYLRQIMEYNEIDFAVSGGEQDGNAEIWLDNVKIERLGNDFGAKIVANTANTIDVKLDYVVDKKDIADLTASSFTLAKAGADTAVEATSVEKLSGDTLRFTFASDLESGASYSLTFGEAIGASWFNGNVITAGSKINFTTNPATQETVLYENDFNTYAFPDRAAAAALTDMYYYWGFTNANAGWGGNNGYIHQMADMRERSTGDNYFDFGYSNWWGEHNQGIRIPFQNATDGVSTGKLVAEFDLKISDTYDISGYIDDAQLYKVVFGFKDKNLTYGNGALLPGTLFMTNAVLDSYRVWEETTGISHDEPGKNMRSIFTSTADYAQKITSTNNREIAKGVNLDYEDEWHTYKIEVDLDSNYYDIYRDGAYLATSDVMPGNVTDGVYTEFVMGVNGLAGNRKNDALNMGIDNLVVKNVQEYPIIENAEFVKYDDTTSAYAETVSAGTTKVDLVFSKDISDDVIPYITVSGDAEYSVSTATNVATVEFTNALNAGETYTITVGAGAPAANGLGLASDVIYTFTADEGEIKFAVPSIKEGDSDIASVADIAEGDSIAVEVPVINTSAEDAKAWIVLAGYAGNKLVSVATLPYTLAADGAYSDTATIPVTVDANLASATTVKAFVFDGITKIAPITAPTTIGE